MAIRISSSSISRCNSPNRTSPTRTLMLTLLSSAAVAVLLLAVAPTPTTGTDVIDASASPVRCVEGRAVDAQSTRRRVVVCGRQYEGPRGSSAEEEVEPGDVKVAGRSEDGLAKIGEDNEDVVYNPAAVLDNDSLPAYNVKRSSAGAAGADDNEVLPSMRDKRVLCCSMDMYCFRCDIRTRRQRRFVG